MSCIIKESLTFDDVLIIPAYSEVLPYQVDLSTQLTEKIRLNIPILSAAMDTVTESKLAIAIAKEGGIGFIHKNMSIKCQAKEIIKVKSYKNKNFFTKDLKYVTPDISLTELKKIIIHTNFINYPVVDHNNTLLGVITNQSMNYLNNVNLSVSDLMTPKENLKIIKRIAIYKIKIIKIYGHKALIVDEKFHILSMIELKDLKKVKYQYFNYCKDNYGRLRVGAAVSVFSKNYEERIDSLVEAEIDILLVDSSHGHSKYILRNVKEIRSRYPDLPIIGGNVVTGKGALALVDAGVNAVKVGIGPGSICTTRIVTGVGVPQITAIFDVAKELKKINIPVIADGGIRFSGDIAKAIAAGANCVMIGLLLAGSKESPGKIRSEKGQLFKYYRGMGSLHAMFRGSAEQYFQSYKNIHELVPEGVEGKVLYKGNLKKIIYQQIGGLRSCMKLTGCANIKDLQTKTKFIKVSNASIRENNVHDILSIK